MAVDRDSASIWPASARSRRNGTLQAWSGRIAVTALRDTTMDEMMATGSGRSLWVGERAVLDVAARAARRSTSRASPTACCRMAAASRWAAWSTSPKSNVAAPDLHRAAAGQPAGRIRRLPPACWRRRAGGRRQRRRADRHQLGQRPVPGRTDDRAFRAPARRRPHSARLNTPEYKSSAIQDRSRRRATSCCRTRRRRRKRLPRWTIPPRPPTSWPMATPRWAPTSWTQGGFGAGPAVQRCSGFAGDV